MAFYSGHGPRHLARPEPTLEDIRRAAHNLIGLLFYAGQRTAPIISNLNRLGVRMECTATIIASRGTD